MYFTLLLFIINSVLIAAYLMCVLIHSLSLIVQVITQHLHMLYTVSFC